MRNTHEQQTPTVGLEPTTTKLRALRSTDRARRAVLPWDSAMTWEGLACLREHVIEGGTGDSTSGQLRGSSPGPTASQE